MIAVKKASEQHLPSTSAAMTTWQGRKKDVPISKEDEELSRLIIKYNKSLQSQPRQEAAKENAPSTWKTLWAKSTSTQTTTPQPSSSSPFTEPSLDEIIQGKSITYTRAEAQQYANEEPCDSWRHIDVRLPHNPSKQLSTNE
jgi:hypothetical protein